MSLPKQITQVATHTVVDDEGNPTAFYTAAYVPNDRNAIDPVSRDKKYPGPCIVLRLDDRCVAVTNKEAAIEHAAGAPEEFVEQLKACDCLPGANVPVVVEPVLTGEKSAEHKAVKEAEAKAAREAEAKEKAAAMAAEKAKQEAEGRAAEEAAKAQHAKEQAEKEAAEKAKAEAAAAAK